MPPQTWHPSGAACPRQAIFQTVQKNASKTPPKPSCWTKPNGYDRIEREKLSILVKEARDAFVAANIALDTYVDSRSHTTEALIHVFTKYRKTLAFINQIEIDPSLKQRQRLPLELLLVVYLPYWIPILVPLFRRI